MHSKLVSALLVSTFFMTSGSCFAGRKLADNNASSSAAILSTHHMPELNTHAVKIKDLAADFLIFYDKSSSVAEPDKSVEFYQQVVNKAPEIYSEVIFHHFKHVLHEDKQKLLDDNCAQFPGIRARFEKLHKELAGDLGAFIQKFEKRFSDFHTADLNFYIAHSLGYCPDFAPLVNGRVLVYFAVDKLAKQRHVDSLEPFVDEQLFRVYHSQHYCRFEKLHSRLWVEGLAIYAAKQMCSQASDKDLFFDDKLLAETKNSIAEVSADALKHLDEDDHSGKIQARYFDAASKDKIMPARVGYGLGYLLVCEIAKSATIDEMVKWQDAEVKTRMHKTLQELLAHHQTKS